jgi:hypothetical protein
MPTAKTAKMKTSVNLLPVSERVERDITTRAIPIIPSSLDEATRSVEVTMSTQAIVQVVDWRRLEIIDEVLIADGVVFADSERQVPFVDSHKRTSADDCLGSVRNIRTENGETVGRVFFAGPSDDRAERTWQKTKDGHMRSYSVGYEPLEYKDIAPGARETIAGREFTAGKRPLRITMRWALKELSTVIVSADSGATVRTELGDTPEQETKTMPKEKEDAGVTLETTRTETPPPPVDVARIEAEGKRKERERCAAIRELAGTDTDAATQALVTRAITDDWDVTRATAEFLKHVRGQRTPAVEVGKDNSKDQARDLATAIQIRCGVRVDDAKAVERAEQFRGIGLHDTARLCIEAERTGSERIPLDKERLFKRALSTASFPYILGDSANKRLQAAYVENPPTAARWMKRVQVSDFKTYNALQLSGFANLVKLGTGGEFEHSTLTEKKETYSALTYGRQFAITRRDFINDDLGALSRVPGELGKAASRNIDDVAYALLISSAGVGPTMAEDAKALFSTTHASANYATGAGTVLAEAGLSQAKRLMRLTKGMSSETLNLITRWLLVPATLEDTAARFMRSQDRIASIATTGATVTFEGNKNVHAGLGEIIVEPRLDAGTNGTTAWYLISDQIENMILVFLAGNESPTLERHDPTEQLGIGWRIYHDMGVAAVDWRGIVRMAGA